MKKRVLSLVMAFALALSLLPTAALAAGSAAQTATSVAKVGELYYDSLEEAINAAKE